MKILIGLGVWLGISVVYFFGYIHGAVSARNAALDRKEETDYVSSQSGLQSNDQV